MNKRDMEKLESLLVRLTAEFSAPVRQSTVIWRGEARAIVAAIRSIRADVGKVERFRAALLSIAKNTCCAGCQEAARVAKAALSPTDGADSAPPKIRTPQ